MLQVKEVWKLQEDKVVLVCDVFRDDIITNRIFTDVGEYEGSRFRVGIVKKCLVNQRHGILFSIQKKIVLLYGT